MTESLAEREAFSAADIPHIAEEDVPRCDHCASEAFELFAQGRDYELRTCRNEWRFVRCTGCGLVRLHPRPAIEALSTIYPSSYYAYSYESIPWIARAGKAVLDRRKLRSIVRTLKHPVTTYADIGCGTGRYLDAMHATGVAKQSIYGLELDPATVARLRDCGYQAFCERVETCTQIPEASLDLITMFHVIEHVHEPAAVLRRLASWLKPGGVLAIETPNLDSWDARLFRDRWWGGYHNPRHWTLFTPESLQPMLRAQGLEPVALRFQTGHSFWMYSWHHRLRYGANPRPWLARQFDPLTNVLPLAAFTAFDLVRGALGARTSSMLVLARRSDA